ncbi:MAG: PAS domain-containing protein, partial [Giesbergeria sp.]
MQGGSAPSAVDLAGGWALFDALPVAVLAFKKVGAELRLQSANAAAHRLHGLQALGSPGASAAKVFVLLMGTHLLDQLHAVAQLGAPLNCQQVLRDQGQLRLAWKIHAERLRIGSILVTVQDISETEALASSLTGAESALAENQRELREQTEVFSAMESMARSGYWRRIRDEGESVLLWSSGLCDIAGHERQEWISTERALGGVVPEDREVFESAHGAGRNSDVEYRWRRPDGQVRWMRSRVRLPAQQDGMLVEMGVVQDVTEEHRAAEQLHGQLDFIKSIAGNIPGIIYQCRVHLDGSLSLPYLSDAVNDLLGVSEALARKDFQALSRNVVKADLPRLRRSFLRAVRTLSPWYCEYRVRMPGGEVRWHTTRAALQ